MSREPQIETVLMHAGIVVLEGGITLPITNWFDDDGDDCDPEDAVSIVAGSDDYGWLSILLVGEPETLN